MMLSDCYSHAFVIIAVAEPTISWGTKGHEITSRIVIAVFYHSAAT